MNNFNEYQKDCQQTALYPNASNGEIVYPVLGLTGEAGEVAGKVKKLIRDKGYQGDVRVYDEETKNAIIDELGDVLYYIAACATELDIDLSEVARRNTQKLADRLARGVIKGSGDKR